MSRSFGFPTCHVVFQLKFMRTLSLCSSDSSLLNMQWNVGPNCRSFIGSYCVKTIENDAFQLNNWLYRFFFWDIEDKKGRSEKEILRCQLCFISQSLILSRIKFGFAEFIPECFTICNPNNFLRLLTIKRNIHLHYCIFENTSNVYYIKFYKTLSVPVVFVHNLKAQ